MERGGLYAAMWARQQADGGGSAFPSCQDLAQLEGAAGAAAARGGGGDESGGGSGGSGGGKGGRQQRGLPKGREQQPSPTNSARLPPLSPAAAAAGAQLHNGDGAGDGDGLADGAGDPSARSDAAIHHARTTSIRRYQLARSATDSDMTTPAMTPCQLSPRHSAMGHYHSSHPGDDDGDGTGHPEGDGEVTALDGSPCGSEGAGGGVNGAREGGDCIPEEEDSGRRQRQQQRQQHK
jgi:hypothetical protein